MLECDEGALTHLPFGGFEYLERVYCVVEQEDYGSLPEKVRRLRVILVYAEADMLHGDLLSLLKDAMRTHPTVHVYLPAQ